MKKKLLILFVSSLSLLQSLRADEGLWLLPLIEQLNSDEMNKMGCELTSEQIYSINNSSIKDAIVIFGPGCTGEVVSDQGLLFTNHHCGYDAIQALSDVEHDYLMDGFWAKTIDDELPNDDLEVRFVVRIEDVTDSILKKIDINLSEAERVAKIEELSGIIQTAASDSGKFEVEIKPFFAGNKYYLFVYQVYKDVRLVGTPPTSIGKFGYDTDNWVWPRHTGDFSIFRIYTAPDGSSAPYAKENIPLKPKYHLPMSLNGIKKGDFTMVMGFPGTTERYIPSGGIREIFDITNPNRIKIRGVKQNIMMADMQADPKVNIQYAAKYSQSSNYWKYSIGQNKGILQQKLIERKQTEENDFQQWINSDSLREAKYGTLMANMNDIYNSRKDNQFNSQYIVESFFFGAEIIDFAYSFNYLHYLLRTGDTSKQAIVDECEILKKKADIFFKNYNQSTDYKISKALFNLYYQNTIPNQRPDFYTVIDKKFKGDKDKYVDQLFEKSFLMDKNKVMDFLQNPTLKAMDKDIGYSTQLSIINKYREVYFTLSDTEDKLDSLQRKYFQAQLEINSERHLYPDANFTIRLNYGTVNDYEPRDAVKYNYYTTLKGIFEKEDSSNYEFVVPSKLKQLYEQADFGKYSENGTVPVCFITNNDITGGNSGSPVLNGKGQLIGLAFDGNWEAMSSDIDYDSELQRCIAVDIRYVLFIVEKFAGNQRIIDELDIAN